MEERSKKEIEKEKEYKDFFHKYDDNLSVRMDQFKGVTDQQQERVRKMEEIEASNLKIVREQAARKAAEDEMKRKMGLNAMHSSNLNVIHQRTIEWNAEKSTFKDKNEQRKVVEE